MDGSSGGNSTEGRNIGDFDLCREPFCRRGHEAKREGFLVPTVKPRNALMGTKQMRADKNQAFPIEARFLSVLSWSRIQAPFQGFEAEHRLVQARVPLASRPEIQYTPARSAQGSGSVTWCLENDYEMCAEM